MKKNSDFAFIIGYIYSLESELLTYSQIEKIKKSETIEDFKDKLKKERYKIKDFENIEQFNTLIDRKLEKTIEEIKEICPKTKSFEYIFCREYFKTFKIALKQNKTKNKIKSLNCFLKEQEIENIINFIETKNLDLIKPIYRRPFEECLNIFIEQENIKQAEILIDLKMYQILLEISKQDEFLNKRTKLEISLKNISYIIRTLYFEKELNIKELETFLMEDGLISKEKIIKNSQKDLKEILKLYTDLNINSNSFSIAENFNLTDEIEKKILDEFDKNYIFETFCFTPIFLYINSLKKETENLKEIILNIVFKI